MVAAKARLNSFSLLRLRDVLRFVQLRKIAALPLANPGEARPGKIGCRRPYRTVSSCFAAPFKGGTGSACVGLYHPLPKGIIPIRGGRTLRTERNEPIRIVIHVRRGHPIRGLLREVAVIVIAVCTRTQPIADLRHRIRVRVTYGGVGTAHGELYASDWLGVRKYGDSFVQPRRGFLAARMSLNFTFLPWKVGTASP